MSASYLGPSARLLRPKVFVWDNEEVLKVHLCSAGPSEGSVFYLFWNVPLAKLFQRFERTVQ